MHVSLSSKDKAPKVLQNLFKVSLADASVHEFPAHLRDHLVMEAVTIARFVSLQLALDSARFEFTLK